MAAALAIDPAARPTVDQFAARLERGLDRWREIGASRMTGLAAVPVAAAATAGSTLSPDDPTVVDPSLPVDEAARQPVPTLAREPGVLSDRQRHDATVPALDPAGDGRSEPWSSDWP